MMLTLSHSSFISDEQVEPLIRRIEGLQAVIARMKADQATLSQAEGQLREQLAALHQERAKLASEVARHESATTVARESQQRHLKQLQEARETIADLEKKLALAVKPSAIPKPPSAVVSAPAGRTAVEPPPATTTSAAEQAAAKRSQTQLLRARSKNNNPPDKSMVCLYCMLFLCCSVFNVRSSMLLVVECCECCV